MKFPKETKDYCLKCNAHTEHKLKQFKSGSARTDAWGTRKNKAKYKQGYGGKARFNATVKKQSKKPTFLAECAVCGTKHYAVYGGKLKKIEIVTA